jgi:hypothetical protein
MIDSTLIIRKGFALPKASVMLEATTDLNVLVTTDLWSFIMKIIKKITAPPNGVILGLRKGFNAMLTGSADMKLAQIFLKKTCKSLNIYEDFESRTFNPLCAN